MAKRDIIKMAIEEGGATKESLMAVAEVNDKGLASQLTYLRMGRVFPFRDPDTGVYRLLSEEEHETMAANRPSKAASVKRTPLQLVTTAQRKVDRACSAVDRFTKMANANPEDTLLAKKKAHADLTLEIAEIEQGAVDAEHGEAAKLEAEKTASETPEPQDSETPEEPAVEPSEETSLNDEFDSFAEEALG